MTKPEERYFEDYPLGQVMEFGPVDVKQEEIIEFAQKYDPPVFSYRSPKSGAFHLRRTDCQWLAHRLDGDALDGRTLPFSKSQSWFSGNRRITLAETGVSRKPTARPHDGP